MLVRLTDDMVKHLVSFKELETLDTFQAPEISDWGLKTLANVVSLKCVNLEWASWITDAGVHHLEALRNLEWLNLMFCDRVSLLGALDLSKRLPQCKIALGAGYCKAGEYV